MILLDVIRNLDRLDDADTIYAKVPWGAGRLAVVAREPVEGGIPEDARRLGLSYFLEVNIAREFLKDASSLRTPEARCERIIRYAVDDTSRIHTTALTASNPTEGSADSS